MRFFNCLILSFLFLANARAQHNHFVYIQTENKQSFYVKLNDKVLSSSTSGYLVIPKLTDGSYKLYIGFPKNEWPAQIIDITINDTDEGFLLKDFGDKGWGLFNIQSMNIVMGSMVNHTNNTVIPDKTDAFSNTLAEVTNTPSINKQDSVVSVAKTTQFVSAETPKPVIKEEAIVLTPAKQVLSVLYNSGRSIIYATTDEKNTDTVRIFIPYNNMDNGQVIKIAEPVVKTDTAKNMNVQLANDSAVSVTQPVSTEIQKQPESKPVITDIKVGDTGNTNKSEYKITILNPDCRSTATDEDFFKLRKKMAAAENDEDMIVVARKGFRSNCFTTEQVKNLSLLFLKDEGRYNFYDAAYKHVSDIGNFKTLQSQLSDEYFINRFKAMIH